MTKNDVSCQKIHCVSYTSIYEQIFTSYLPFDHNISLTDTFGQATRSWWIIDVFCSTFSSLDYISPFQLHWPSRKSFHSVSLTSLSAEPIRAHLARRSHPATLDIPNAQQKCCALYRSYCPQHNPLHCRLDYPSCYSNLANHQCPKCFQVRCPRCFQLDDGWFFKSGEHSRFQFVLQGGPLQTMLVAMVMFRKI
jgi:hypothetical protein